MEGDKWARWRSSEEWATCVYRCSDKAQQHCHWTGCEVKYMKVYMWISSNIPNVNPAWHYTWGISLFYVPLTKKTCYCMLARDQIKVSQTKLMSRYYDNQTSISMSPVNWHGQLKLTNQSLLKLWNQGYTKHACPDSTHTDNYSSLQVHPSNSSCLAGTRWS